MTKLKIPNLIASLCLLAFSCSAASAASAAEENYSEEWRRCMDVSEGITVAILACNTVEAEKQDKLLNANYQSYLTGMNSEVKQNFIRAQRLWVKFRDENCGAFTSQEADGTLAAIVASSCYLKMTAERANDFVRLPEKQSSN